MADPSQPLPASGKSTARPPLHTILPPLILGTATFNTQYVQDPESMPYRDIVARALSLGVNAFDTSPYYGPSEILLGTALNALLNPATTSINHPPLRRSDYFLITKAGRIAPTEFDYSPRWVRYSVLRSLQRLHTPYLDLVYMHDVEFASPAEVLAAVRELRRLRDEEGIVRYVGISGFPVGVLCDLAEMIRAETGEAVDAVMSYGHFTVQNRELGLPWVAEEELAAKGGGDSKAREASPLARLQRAGVDVVLNASMLGMGLLTSKGIPVDSQSEVAGDSPLAKWHPSPPGLRSACKKAADLAAAAGERLESVAIRWSLAEWARLGAAAGVGADVSTPGAGTRKIGPTVCGVSSIAELEETVEEWRDVVTSLGQAGGGSRSVRQEKVSTLVRKELWPALGSWLDYAWDSPESGFVNARQEFGVVPDDGVVAAHEERKRAAESKDPAI